MGRLDPGIKTPTTDADARENRIFDRSNEYNPGAGSGTGSLWQPGRQDELQRHYEKQPWYHRGRRWNRANFEDLATPSITDDVHRWNYFGNENIGKEPPLKAYQAPAMEETSSVHKALHNIQTPDQDLSGEERLSLGQEQAMGAWAKKRGTRGLPALGAPGADRFLGEVFDVKQQSSAFSRFHGRRMRGASHGSMEQYRLEDIEMTDLGQDAQWAQDMQKAVEDDKLHEHHSADAAGRGGGAAPTMGDYGRRRGGGVYHRGGDDVGHAETGKDGATETGIGADQQGKPGEVTPGAVTAVGGGSPRAFIMHHTGGRGTAAGVQETLRQRHLGVQYVMDREGKITRIGGPGEHHILPGSGVGRGLNNRNVVGMEVIAKNDADVTPAQVAAAKAFIAKYYPHTPVFGHGEVNPGHKEASEGRTITNAIRAQRKAGLAGDMAEARTAIPRSPVEHQPQSTGSIKTALSAPGGNDPRTAIVRTEANLPQGRGVGSAFYVGNGEFITAKHNTGNENHVSVSLGGTRAVASVIPGRGNSDYTTLRVSPSSAEKLRASGLKSLSLASGVPGAGETLSAHGYPGSTGQYSSVSGKFLGVAEQNVLGGAGNDQQIGRNYLVGPHTGASSLYNRTQGMSGGPVLNRQGQVVGLLTGVSGSGNESRMNVTPLHNP